MAAPSVVSTTHPNGSENRFINLGIEIEFAEALDSSTVNENTFLLTDITTLESVSRSVSLTKAGILANKQVIVQPNFQLKQNTLYRLVIVGADQAITDTLTSSDGTKLQVSIVYEFTTGDDVYSIDPRTEKTTDDETLEGDLFLPSNVKALGTDFTIEKVRPKNHTADVAVNLTGDNKVRFTFSKVLSGTSTGIAEWATIETYPLLDETYLASGSAINSSAIMPTGSISITGSDLVITFDRDFPQNSAVDITLNDKITSTSGSEYGGNLEYTISFSRYPDVFNVRAVKGELGSTSVDFRDDYIATLLHKNSMFIWEKMGRGIDLSSVSWPAKRYILITTVLDLIEDRDFEKYLVSGTQKQLGDVNVSAFTLAGRLAIKIQRLMKDKELAFQSLNKGWQFKTAIKQESAEGVVTRLWYDVSQRYTDPHKKYEQTAEPIANRTTNRRAATTNPNWWL